jgi:class 3 adenylate cyclase
MPPESSSMDANSCPPGYRELLTSCWHSDRTLRPTFLEIMTRLSGMHGVDSSALVTSSTHSHELSARCDDGGHDHGSSWTLPSAMSVRSDNSSEDSLAPFPSGARAKRAGSSLPPEGEVAIVCSDISRAASLWEFDAEAMRDATLLHNDILRAALKRHHGYESAALASSFSRGGDGGEGSFCMVFQQVADALNWCAGVQMALLEVEWPTALLDHPGAGQELGDASVVYKGLRVRMGVHVGTPKVVRDPMTRRVEYIGPGVDAAARITAMTHGGQIVLSQPVHDKLGGTTDTKRIQQLGKFDIYASHTRTHARTPAPAPA